jgi:hypothetical protein
MSEFYDMPAGQAEASVPKKKRRGCLVSTAVFFLIFPPLLALFLNGPGFRYLARYAGVKAAGSQGLKGDFEIQGNLWSGFALNGIDFAGDDGGTTSLTVEEFAVGYNALDLILNSTKLTWLERVRIKKARIDLYLPDPGEKTPKEKEPAARETKAPPTEFSPLWNLLASDILIEDLTVFVHQGETTFAVENLTLATPAATDGKLHIGKVALPGQQALETVEAVLSRGEHELIFGPLPLLQYATLERLTFAETSPGAWSVDALVRASDGMLTASFQTPGEIALGLRPGSPLSLDKLVLPMPEGKTSELKGALTDLDLRFSGDFAEPATWKINGKLIASGAGWGKHGADTVMLLVTDNELHFEAARHRTTVRATAALPFEKAASIEDLGTLPLTLGMEVKVPSVEELVSDFTDKAPLSGALTLTAQDIQIVGGKTIQSGSLLLLSDDLAWDGIRLSGSQIAANVASDNHLRFAGELGLDEANHLRLSGHLDVASLTYEAGTQLEIDTAARLGTVLADLEVTGLSGAGKVNWTGSGQIREKQHLGKLDLDLAEFVVGEGQPITGKVAARYDGMTAALETLRLSAGDVALAGTGSWDGKIIALPDWKLTRAEHTPLSLVATFPFEPGREGGFLARTGPLDLNLKLDSLALEEVTRFFSARPPLAGRLQGELTGKGTFDAIDLDGQFEFRSELKPGGTADASADAPNPQSLVSVALGLDGSVRNPSTWDARLDALVSGLHWDGMEMENISLKATTDTTDTTSTTRPLLAELRFDQSETTLGATARFELGGAATFADLKMRSLQLDATLAVKDFAPLLRDFAPAKFKGLPLSGALDATVAGLTVKGGSLTGGTFTVGSDSFAVEGQRFEPLSLTADIPETDLVKVILAAALDAKNQVNADGSFHLKDQIYTGKLALNTDLESKDSKLRKLLSGRAITALLPALTTLNWEGKGDLIEFDHAGDLTLVARKVTLAEGAEPIDLDLAGTYTGTSADFPTVKITSRPLNLTGAIQWRDRRLEFVDWRGQSGGREVITITGGIPLDRERLTPALWFGQESPLDLAMQVKSLPVQTLSRLFLKESPVHGDLSLDLAATGTPTAPGIDLELLFDRILVPREKESIAAGRLELALKGAAADLSLSGKYEHPDIKPLVITAALPFQPGAWARGERKVADESLTASAKMEHSSLGFLAAQIPAIESITGAIAIDAEVRGTVSKPEIRGSGMLDVSRLRLVDRNAPSLHDIDLAARFEENRIVLEKLYAVVAGGIVEGSGEAILKPGEEPVLNLSLNGSEVLVFRNTDVNVRTDLTIRLNGPFSKASLTGEIGITNSRFFKNFDLLPLGMPTRNTSVLPTVERAPGGGGPAMPDLDVGVEIAPFRDWTVDLRLHTKDPFLIRTNLVESSIRADLRVLGKLGHPYPVGNVDIARGELTLPFSKVDVETGRIKFDQSTGFNGAVEFKARGKADRYQISIYLFNRILSPQYVLTSIPPLPSEDIVTLLATGTTRNELVGGDPGSMAATKAATLFIKNLRKTSDKVEGEPTLLDTLEERTELEIGRVNQETGEQTFGGKIRLWKQLFFVGDVDADSDYRALLKYVFSFR